MAEHWSSKPIMRVRFLPPLRLKCFTSMLIITMFDQTVRSLLGLFYRLTATGATQGRKVKRPTPSMVRTHYIRVLRTLAPAQASRFAKHPTLTLSLTLYYAVKRLGYSFVAMLLPTLASSFLATLDQLRLPLSPRSLISAVTRVTLILLSAYFLLIYIHLACQLVPFAKILFAWLSAGAFLYLLVSGFVYFTNKLSYASNVDVLQRF